MLRTGLSNSSFTRANNRRLNSREKIFEQERLGEKLVGA